MTDRLSDYRGYIGWADQYGTMSKLMFRVLDDLGLEEHHKVLDFGCGSLRLGRLLIPFLNKGCYFGIEPNDWLMERAWKLELGNPNSAYKMPRLVSNDDFNMSIFNHKFDFIMAQSILTHCGPGLVRIFFNNARQALKPDGKLVFTFARDAEIRNPEGEKWYYPECVEHRTGDIVRWASPFRVAELAYGHPSGHRWCLGTLK